MPTIRAAGELRALVIFHDQGMGFASRFLKPGFRHCAVAVDDGDYWVGFDGVDGRPDLRVIADADFDLAGHHEAQGHHAVEVRISRRPLGAGPGLNTCVGAIKRILGIKAPWLQTPHQLYRHLVRNLP